jgi:hypothetical protein
MLSRYTAAPSRYFPRDPTKKEGKPVGTFGWCTDGTKPLWRIEKDTRLPFPLLPVSVEINING